MVKEDSRGKGKQVRSGDFWNGVHSELKEVYHAHVVSFWDDTYKYFERCEKILDVGCGRGRFLRFFPQRSIGMDINIESLREAKNKGLQVIKGDGLVLPFKDCAFDGVRCAHLIEHLFPSQVHGLLLEMARVVREDGILLIESPLMHRRFYDELSHVRPYPPNALLSYFLHPSKTQQTFESLPYCFKFLKLKWRYGKLFYPSIEPFWNPSKFKKALFFKIISLFLYKLGIHSLKKDGYICVFKKTRKLSKDKK